MCSRPCTYLTTEDIVDNPVSTVDIADEEVGLVTAIPSSLSIPMDGLGIATELCGVVADAGELAQPDETGRAACELTPIRLIAADAGADKLGATFGELEHVIAPSIIRFARRGMTAAAILVHVWLVVSEDPGSVSGVDLGMDAGLVASASWTPVHRDLLELGSPLSGSPVVCPSGAAGPRQDVCDATIVVSESFLDAVRCIRATSLKGLVEWSWRCRRKRENG